MSEDNNVDYDKLLKDLDNLIIDMEMMFQDIQELNQDIDRTSAPHVENNLGDINIERIKNKLNLDHIEQSLRQEPDSPSSFKKNVEKFQSFEELIDYLNSDPAIKSLKIDPDDSPFDDPDLDLKKDNKQQFADREFESFDAALEHFNNHNPMESTKVDLDNSPFDDQKEFGSFDEALEYFNTHIPMKEGTDQSPFDEIPDNQSAVPHRRNSIKVVNAIEKMLDKLPKDIIFNNARGFITNLESNKYTMGYDTIKYDLKGIKDSLKNEMKNDNQYLTKENKKELGHAADLVSKTYEKISKLETIEHKIHKNLAKLQNKVQAFEAKLITETGYKEIKLLNSMKELENAIQQGNYTAAAKAINNIKEVKDIFSSKKTKKISHALRKLSIGAAGEKILNRKNSIPAAYNSKDNPGKDKDKKSSGRGRNHTI